jgi:hypothetical protein
MTSAGVQGGIVGWPAMYNENVMWELRGVVDGRNRVDT